MRTDRPCPHALPPGRDGAAMRGCRFLAGAALALVAGSSGAESHPYTIGLSASVGHESNLLRLADDQPAPEGYRRSDSIRSVVLLAGLDQAFGRERVYANLSLRDSRYAANSIYDNQGYTAQAGLDWSTVGRVSGSLSANANRALYSFNIGYDGGFLRRVNLQDTRDLSASVAIGLVTQYSLMFSAGHRQVGNSLDDAAVQALDYRQDNASVGLRWRPSSAAAWTVNLVQTRGRYPKYQPLPTGGYAGDRFRQTSLDLGLAMQTGGASDLDLHVGISRLNYELNEGRDFTGATGRAVWSWQPGARLRLSTRLSRDTGQNSYAVTVFGTPGTAEYSRVYDSLGLQAGYELSAKIGLTASWQVVQRTTVNTIDNPWIPLSAQDKDRTESTAVGVRWTPRRSLVAGCDFSHLQRRTRGALSVPLHDDRFACFGQLQLQR